MNQTTVAKLKYLKVAPRKARFVADLIRGLSVGRTEAQKIHSAGFRPRHCD
jgi:ribosomal protein L22